MRRRAALLDALKRLDRRLVEVGKSCCVGRAQAQLQATARQRDEQNRDLRKGAAGTR